MEHKEKESCTKLLSVEIKENHYIILLLKEKIIWYIGIYF